MNDDFKIIKLEPREDYTVKIYLNNGVCCIYNADKIIEKYKKLKEVDIFINSCEIVNGMLTWNLQGECINITPEVLIRDSHILSSWYFERNGNVKSMQYGLLQLVLKSEIIYRVNIKSDEIIDWYFGVDELLIETNEEFIKYSIPELTKLNVKAKTYIKENNMTKEEFLERGGFKEVSEENEIELFLKRLN
ncbi:hypothetical protein [Clostridium sp. ETTB3]